MYTGIWGTSTQNLYNVAAGQVCMTRAGPYRMFLCPLTQSNSFLTYSIHTQVVSHKPTIYQLYRSETESGIHKLQKLACRSWFGWADVSEKREYKSGAQPLLFHPRHLFIRT